MSDVKQDAIEIASLLAAAESANPSAELEALHAKIRHALYAHRDLLGLSNDDVADIDNYGYQARGGTPKGRPPEA